MNIQIQGIRYQPSNEDKDFVETRIGNLERFLSGADDEPIAEVNLELVEETHKNKKDIFRTEAVIKYAGQSYRAEDTKRSLEKSITGVMEKLSKEIRRKKGKNQSLLRRGRGKINQMFGR